MKLVLPGELSSQHKLATSLVSLTVKCIQVPLPSPLLLPVLMMSHVWSTEARG